MNTTLLIVLIAVIVVAAIGAFLYMQKRRTETLRTRFGPEYEHAVHQLGDRSRAERALEKRAERTALLQKPNDRCGGF